jgi:hypothetical protein
MGLSLPCFLQRRALARAQEEKSKHAILIFLAGGPSHHETFDPKPDASAEVRGEFGTVATSVPGIHFSDKLPLLAAQMKHLAILRALTHRASAHEPGVATMNTGYDFRPGNSFPSAGSVIGYLRRESTKASGLPSYFGLPGDPQRGGGGHLGTAYNALPILGDPSSAAFRVEDLTPPEDVGDERFRRRRELFAKLGDDFRRDRDSEERTAVERFTAQAYDLVTSPKARAALDLTREGQKSRERYGMSAFGQRLLLARRLVEAGVPCISVTDPDWDHHQNIFSTLKTRLPILDRGIAALLADLDERGLLASTLVVVMGEFGRTPKINPARGRDHWSEGFSVALAGGGVKGGQVIGATDKDGAYPKERPVRPEELFHSLYTLMGIDPTKYLPSTSGREIQIVRDGKFIRELT